MIRANATELSLSIAQTCEQLDRVHISYLDAYAMHIARPELLETEAAAGSTQLKDQAC